MPRLLLLILISLSVMIGGFVAYQNIEYKFETSGFAFSTETDKEKYEKYIDNFGIDINGFTIGLYKESGYRSYEDFQALEQLCRLLLSSDQIADVFSIQEIEIPVKKGLNVSWIKALKDDGPENFEENYAHLWKQQDIVEKFISADKKAICLYINPAEEYKSKDVIDHIEKSVSALPELSDELHIMGGDSVEDEGIRVLQEETIFLSLMAAIIMTIGLLILIPNLRQLLVTFLITGMNVALCLISMVLLDIPITVLTSAVPSIIAILSFTDQLHIHYHHKKLVSEGISRTEIRKQLFKKIGIPLLLTSAANLLGFLVFFLNGGVEHVNDLALAASVGIVISYLLSRLFLPYFLSPKEGSQLVTQKAYEKLVDSLIVWLQKRRRLIVGLSSVGSIAILIILINYTRIDSHYYNITDSEEDLKFELAAAFYDTNFQGIRDIEVVIESENELYTMEVVRKIDEIENYLLTEYGCKTTYSLNTIIKRYERYRKAGRPEAYQLPEKLSSTKVEEIKRFKEELGLKRIMSENGKMCRVIGSINDIGSNEAYFRNEKLEEFVAGLNEGDLKFSIAGQSRIYDNSLFNLSHTVLICLGIGLVLIGIGIGILFRSVIIGFLVLWANLLPIGFAMVLMVLLDVDLHPSSIFMLTILLGVALDDSIYLVGNVLKMKSRKGISNDIVLSSMRLNSFPLLVTSVVIGLSFLALLFSTSTNTFAFGTIMSASLIFAYLTDLLFLPAALLLVAKEEEK